MSKMLNVSWPGLDSEALKRKAAECGIRETGVPYSVSELIRKAVEAYTDGYGEIEGHAPLSRGVLRSIGKRVGVGCNEQATRPGPWSVDPRELGMGGRLEEYSGEREGVTLPVDTTPAGWQPRMRCAGCGAPAEGADSWAEGRDVFCSRECATKHEAVRFHAVIDEGWERIRRPVTKESQTKRGKG